MREDERFPYDKEHQEVKEEVKKKCRELEMLILSMGPGRAIHHALNKLEECYMWTGKAVAFHQKENEGKDGVTRLNSRKPGA